MKFADVKFAAPADCLHALTDFYSSRLEFDVRAHGRGRLAFAIGETAIEFVAASRQPFYHFALLVPGNRFHEAFEWAGSRTELLPDPDSGKVVFDFGHWAAEACYFHDPAENIVELITHRGIDETDAKGAFSPSELVGLSELGLVGDPPGMARELSEHLALFLWDGTIGEPGRLAFIGERGRTLILAQPGRGWLPTRRAAEPHPVQAVIAGTKNAQVALQDRKYRIRSVPT